MIVSKRKPSQQQYTHNLINYQIQFYYLTQPKHTPSAPMKISTLQRIILVSTALIILSMSLFPPYVVRNAVGGPIMTGYSFAFKLPIFLDTRYSAYPMPAAIDTPTLLTQIAVTTILGALLFISAKKN